MTFPVGIGLKQVLVIKASRSDSYHIFKAPAGALNMWYESDLDALMTRTCLRPIPTGKVNRNQALIFGVTLSIVSVVATTETIDNVTPNIKA